MTHEELRELLNTDISVPADQPTPDPAWDYYPLWENLHKIKDEINEILSFVAQFENASDETDEKIRNRLNALTYSVEDLERTSL